MLTLFSKWAGFMALLWMLVGATPVGSDDIMSSVATQTLPTGKPLVFGVVPQQSAIKLAREWAPLLDELSRLSDIPLRFATAPDIPTFEQRIQDGEYDVAYMNPYHYVTFHDRIGLEPLVTASGQRLHGIIVTRKDAPFTSIDDLDGAELAFAAPAAFAATMVIQSSLQRAGVAFSYQYVNSHDAVYRSVASGRFVAGGGITRTFDSLPAEERDQLRILWESPGFTPHAIAAHPRVSVDVRDALRLALTELDEQPQGAKLLASLRISGFIPAVDSDWNDVRDLGIEGVIGKK